MYNEIINYYLTRGLRSGRTSEVKFDDDGKLIGFTDMFGTTHSTQQTADRVNKTYGLTSRTNYHAPLGSPEFSSGGASYSTFVREFQRRMGSEYEVQLETYSIKEHNFEELKRALSDDRGNLLGYLNPGDKSSSFLRVRRVGGEYLTHDEIARELQDKTTFQAIAGSKTPKRMKAIFNDVPYAIFGDNRLNKTIVFTHEDIPGSISSFLGGNVSQSQKAAEAAFDGVVHLNPEHGPVFIEKSKADAIEMARLGGRVTGDETVDELIAIIKASKPASYSDMVGLNNAIKALENAKDMEDALVNGGMFNFRGVGLDIVHGPKESGVRYSGKGNAIFLRPDIAERLKEELVQETGIEDANFFVLTHETNIHSEIGFDPTSGGYTTLDPRRGSGKKPVFLDVDTMFTHQDTYSLEEVLRHNKAEIEHVVSQLKRGEIPENLATMLDRFEGDLLPGDIVARQALQERRGWLATLERMRAYGIPVTDNPMYVRQLINSLEDQLYKGDIPKLQLPDTIRSEVISKPAQALGVHRASLNKIQEGFFDVDGDRIIISDKDYWRYYESLGGPDYDDAFLSSLKWDTQRNRVVAVVGRQPTGQGERVILDVDHEAKVIERVLSKRTDDQALAYGILRDQKMTSLREAEKIAREEAKQRSELISNHERNLKSIDNQLAYHRQRYAENQFALDLDLDRQLAGGQIDEGVDHLAIRAARDKAERNMRLLEDLRAAEEAALGHIRATTPVQLANSPELIRADLKALQDQYFPRLLGHIEGDRISWESLSWDNFVSEHQTEVRKLHGLNEADVIPDDVLYNPRVLDQTYAGRYISRVAANVGLDPATAARKGGLPEIFHLDKSFGDQVKAAMKAQDELTGGGVFDQRYVLQVQEAAAKIEGQLGSYTNARMIASSFFNDNRDILTKDLFDNARLNIVASEAAIDASTGIIQLANDDSLASRTDEIYKSIGRVLDAAAEKGLTPIIDPKIFDYKGRDHAKALISEGLSDGRKLADFYAEGRATSFFEGAEEIVDELRTAGDELVSGSRLSAAVDNIAFDQVDIDAAEAFLDVASERLKIAREMANDPSGLLDEFDNIYDKIGSDQRAASIYAEAHADILDYLKEHFGGDGDRMFRIYGAAMQRSEVDRSRQIQSIFNKSLFDNVSVDIGGGESLPLPRSIDMASLTQATQAHFKGIAAREGREIIDPDILARQSILTEYVAEQVEVGNIGIPESQRPFSSMAGREAKQRAIRQAQERTLTRDPGKFEPVQKELPFRQLMDNSTFKKGGIGLLALVGASFLYQGMKGRSQEDMSGPELLPGGSAYEPMPAPTMSYQSDYRGGGSSGINYRVQVRDVANSHEMMGELSQLTGSNVNGTMYNRSHRDFNSDYGSVIGELYG